jgi:ABC-type bacteriocin/lantibiotic exporter with double-glycine peptidase domain
MSWFLIQIRPFLRTHILSVALIIISSLTFLLDPLIVKWLIDEVLPRRDARLLTLAAAAIAGVYLCQLGCYAAGGILSFQTVQNLVFAIRIALFQQINRLSADFHESVPLGEKLYRIEQDVDQVAELGSSMVPSLLQTGVTTLFVLSTMFVLNFRLTCVLLPLMPAFVIIKKRYESTLRRVSDSAQAESSKENNLLQEHLSAVVQIQLLRQQESQAHVLMRQSHAKLTALCSRNVKEILFRTWYLGTVAVGMIAILAYGGYQVFWGALTVGGFVAFYSYLGRLFAPLSTAVDIYSRFNRLNSSIQRILEIADRNPTVTESAVAIALPAATKGAITFKEVFFSYEDGPPVLSSLDLHIHAGEKIALVGVSGSGKSTIIKLVARLYDVNQGSLRINGVEVRETTLDSLRRTVCYVSQEPILFDKSIEQNLLLAKPDASLQELWEAIEIAGLASLVRSLPKGWNTPVGPKANYLSGGEKQRVALARAALQRPAVLLLDESTSALDMPSERQAYMNLTRHFSDQTIVFVSHRVSALSWVDRIVVLNKGAVEAMGSHDELMARGGLYAQLHSGDPLFASSANSRSSPDPTTALT